MKLEIDITLIERLVAATNDLIAVVRELKCLAVAAREKADAKDEKRESANSASEQCDRILDLCEQLPSRAEDFGVSIIEKIESIREWITTHDHVTDAQQEALDNMEAGVEKWL